MTRAVLAHLSALAAVAIAAAAGLGLIYAGMLAFLGPLAVRLAVRDAFAVRHARAALRFNVSIALYLAATVVAMRTLVGHPWSVQLVPFCLFLTIFLAFNWLAFTLIAAPRAGSGQTFTYPMTLGRN
jgi:uncharacterized Tic20 family protein